MIVQEFLGSICSKINLMCHIFPVFCTMVQNLLGTKIKKIRSDKARDYFNQNLPQWFKKEEIIHESSCITTPQQNGVAERKNRHVF